MRAERGLRIAFLVNLIYNEIVKFCFIFAGEKINAIYC